MFESMTDDDCSGAGKGQSASEKDAQSEQAMSPKTRPGQFKADSMFRFRVSPGIGTDGDRDKRREGYET
jgi:hypothetical protein